MGGDHGRTVRVLAVFGSSERATLRPAEAVGAEIARRGAVLLTGGGRGQGRPAVKESAMDGADAARSRGLVAARVGVLGREERRVEADVDDDGTKIVLSLGLGDRRNYVNALMCDAAIAFDGGDGTKSEVAFCVALGRPVVVVGDGWGAAYPVVRDRRTLDAFLARSRHRVPGDEGDAVDRMITDAYARLSPTAEAVVARHALADPAADVVETALSSSRVAGRYPAFEDADLRGVGATYAGWLAGMDARLRAAGG